MTNITESGGNVNPKAWAEEEARREHEQNQKAFGAIRAGLLGGLSAVCKEIEYRRVSGILYSLHPNGGFRVQAELEDYCGSSVTIAAPRDVQVLGLDPESGDARAKAEDPHIAKLSAVLKQALRTQIPVICDSKEYGRLRAVLYRLAPQGQGLRIQVELENREGRIITSPFLSSVEIHNPGTCDEACWIETEADE